MKTEKGKRLANAGNSDLCGDELMLQMYTSILHYERCRS
jgi:hypothetical protein